MLRVKELHKHYGSFHAVRGITFDVARGEIVGFLGPNGAGKTTTMKIVVGYMGMSAGDAWVDGHHVLYDSLAVRQVIGYLPENAPVYEDMSVLEYLRFICGMRGLRGARRKERIDYVVDVCDLVPKRRALVKTLSKGYRQRVGLAQAIVHDPKLVILDEPTVGLDPNQVVEIRELIREIGRENTVVLSSHILSEVEAMCQRVIIVHEGRIAANGTPRQLADSDVGDYAHCSVTIRGAAAADAPTLGAIPGASSASSVGPANGTARFEVEASDVDAFTAGLTHLVGEKAWVIDELSTRRPSLEDIFRKLTSSGSATGAPLVFAREGGSSADAGAVRGSDSDGGAN